MTQVANVRGTLDAVMASPSPVQVYLAHTDWLNDRDIDEIEALESEFEEQFDLQLAAAQAHLGPPAYDDRADRDAIDAWYPEALRFAGWRHRDGLVFLALEHHDRETPIALLVGFVTQGEIDELSA
jgi:hypothetical protein